MVDTQKIRDEFTVRLNHALDGVPAVRKGRGRNVDVHKLLAERGWPGTTQGSHKWFKAESMPEKDGMRMLAKICGVRAEWLEYGNGPMKAREVLMTEEGVQATAETPDFVVSEAGRSYYVEAKRSLDRLEPTAGLEELLRAVNGLTDKDLMMLAQLAHRMKDSESEEQRKA